MVWQDQFVIILPFILAIVITAGLGVMNWLNTNYTGRLLFSANLLGLSLWSVINLNEILSTTLAVRVFWFQLHNVALVFLSIIWFLFIYFFTDDSRRVTPLLTVSLGIPFLAYAILAFTNSAHQLLWTRITLPEEGYFSTLVVSYGWLVILFSLYLIGLTTATTLLLLRMRPHAKQQLRHQINILIVLPYLPITGIVLHLVNWKPYPRFYPIPWIVFICGIISALIIFQFQLGKLFIISPEMITTGLTDGLIILNDENQIMDMNPAAKIVLGLEHKGVIGAPLENLWPEWENLFAGFLRGREKSTEVSFGGGFHKRTFDIRISNSFDKNGEFACRMVVLSDISDLKQAQAALQKAHDELELRVVERTAELALAESRYRSVMEQSVDAIFLIDLETQTILEANTAFQELLGYRPKDIHSLQLYDIIAHAAADLNTIITRVSEGKEMVMVEGFFQHQDGSIMDVEVGASLISYGDRQAICAVARDIRTRKQAERDLENYAKELERSNAELEQFAYVASHDLQEPLRMVTSFVQLLDRRYRSQLDEDASDFINYAAEGAQRMQHLIHDLLNYSRIGAQREPFEIIDCDQVVHAALNNLQLAIEESQATVSYDSLPSLRADARQLIQLFQNLIGNAIKFRGEDPLKIHISAERSNGIWKFSVVDNGIGMNPDHKDKIFLIFQRLHTSEKYPGTGVGLAICKRIVERHNGQIWAESGLGEGSTFYFTIATDNPHE